MVRALVAAGDPPCREKRVVMIPGQTTALQCHNTPREELTKELVDIYFGVFGLTGFDGNGLRNHPEYPD